MYNKLGMMEEDNLRSASRADGGKQKVQLQPDMQADEATRLILVNLLETMRANEDGIKADSDVECLHAYRVAVRRTRSALRQMRRVLPKGRARDFERAFAGVGRMTNELRDLDVCLLAEAGYRAMLPGDMQQDIAPLFEHWRALRVQALAAVVAYLQSDEYACLLDGWQRFLQEPAGASRGSQATVPICTLARRLIGRQYNRVVEKGMSLLDHVEDKRLHALRIECKQLRYLLEFFASLFPPAEITPLVRQLKRLQDNLGAITDLSVQRSSLLALAGTLALDDARARRTLLATGFLIAGLERRQQEEKAAFAAIFREFASPVHQEQFRRLFRAG